tara:strand:- start:13315 stop:14427 length:1113 start_codon:yes stop_codon:yes gene_type:complete
MKNLKACLFISDEGFGHTIRQRALISEFLKKKVKITVVTSSKISLLKEKFGNLINYRIKYNNIETFKKKNGSLDLIKTKKMFLDWFNCSSKWISEEKKFSKSYDFFVSDFVPEAFILGEKLNIKCYGVCHFTWDWFYEKILRGENKILKKLKFYISKATKIYFPPLTSKDNLKKYKDKVKLVNFILSDFDFKKKVKKRKKLKKCLIMDNGNSTLRSLIIKTIPYLKKIKNIEFIIRTDLLDKKSQKEIMESDNLIPVFGLKNTHSKILECDFLVARGGYNTISECLVLNKPSLLFEEKDNPEINYNLNTVFNLDLCDLLKRKDWGKNFKKKLYSFNKHKMKKIKKTFEGKKFTNTGSKEIALDILKQHNN